MRTYSTYKQHADARTHAQTHGHMHTCTTYTCAHESRRSTNKIRRGHSSSARTVCGPSERQQAPQARVRHRRRSAEGPQGRSGGWRGLLRRTMVRGRSLELNGAWGLFSTVCTTTTTTPRRGCPARRPNGYKVRIMQDFRPSRRNPFAVAASQSHAAESSRRPACQRSVSTKVVHAKTARKTAIAASFGLLFIVNKFVRLWARTCFGHHKKPKFVRLWARTCV